MASDEPPTQTRTTTRRRPRRRRPDTPANRARVRHQAVVRRRRVAALAVLLLLVGGAVAFAVIARGGEAEPKPGASTGTEAGAAAATTAAQGSTADAAASTATTGAEAQAAADRPPPDGPPLTIGWSGDTVPAASAFGLPPDPTELLRRVAGTLKGADLSVGNLEGTLTTRGASKCGAGSSDCYSFRSPPAYARNLANAGFDVMSLANNHGFDYGRVGLTDTRAALKGAGISHTGAPGQVTVETVQGVRIAVVGFASYTWSAPLNNAAKVRRLVQKADGQADLVVVAFHGGAEGSDKQHVPTGGESQFGENRGNLRAFARTAIDAGADLVVGSGPHVVRGMQFYKGRLIAYSAGNFVGYKVFSLGGALSVSYVLEATLKPDGTWVEGRLVATRLISPGYADLDSSGAAIRSVRDLSQADFGASAARIGDDGTIRPPA